MDGMSGQDRKMYQSKNLTQILQQILNDVNCITKMKPSQKDEQYAHSF